MTAELRAMQAEKTRKRAAQVAATEDDGPNDGPNGGGKAAPPPAEKEPRASTTDAQARVMKMADGGFRPAYNVQFTADTKSGAVASVAVDNVGSDMGRLEPTSTAMETTYGRRPGEHLADGGYARLDDITALARAGVTPYVPIPAPRDKARDRFAPRPGDPPEVAAWRERMANDEAREIYKQRAATVECVNAQARNRGLTRFLVRGMGKVKAVALWHALAHNMACSWRLAPA